MTRLHVRLAAADNRGEPLLQLSTPRWWFGLPPHGFPYIQRPANGNQLYKWSVWLRLPFIHELEIDGAPL